MKQYPSEITIKQRRIKFDFVMKLRKLASELVEKMRGVLMYIRLFVK